MGIEEGGIDAQCARCLLRYARLPLPLDALLCMSRQHSQVHCPARCLREPVVATYRAV